MNTPTLTTYEESIAPWNKKEVSRKHDVTVTLGKTLTISEYRDSSPEEIKDIILQEVKDTFEKWNILNIEIDE